MISNGEPSEVLEQKPLILDYDVGTKRPPNAVP